MNSKWQKHFVSTFFILLLAFSACGGLRTSLLFRTGYGHLGKGWIGRGTTTRKLPYWGNGLFYIGFTKLQLIGSNVADCQALT